MRKVLKLYEGCYITQGKSRSLIMDVQRDKLYFIPNSLAVLFNEEHILETNKIEDTISNQEVIKEYREFLLNNELCFLCDEGIADNFPVIDKHKWDYPAHITNAIIELNADITEKQFSYLEQLTHELLTRHIEVFFPEPIAAAQLQIVLGRIDNLDLLSYNVIIQIKDIKELDTILSIFQAHYKIFRAIIGKAGKEDIIESDKAGCGNIFLCQDAFSYKACGVTDPFNFCNNTSHITESGCYNTCLNRKLFADIDGNIKNCPNTPEIYSGNSIKDVITHKDFQQYWFITKDAIEGCKECEFRNICTDCRAFREDPENLYSKPLKCGYDPATCTWSDWSANELKKKGIEFYGFDANI